MSLYQETISLMRKYGITAQKSYGQNFLTNENIIYQIVAYSDISMEDLVFEIGPGLGNLTSELLRHAGKVIAIELDPKMISILNDRFASCDNFELINDDVLKIDFDKLINQNSNYKSFKVVANLPYYITTPIIMKLLEEKTNLDLITVMVQKEVAERLNALSKKNHKKSSKDVGAISYAIKYYANSKVIINVPKENFLPVPKVDSSVIVLDILETPAVETGDEKFLFKLIKTSYMQKRKTLVNSLENGKIIDKDSLIYILETLKLDPRVRPEQLTLQDFANIAKLIQK